MPQKVGRSTGTPIPVTRLHTQETANSNLHCAAAVPAVLKGFAMSKEKKPVSLEKLINMGMEKETKKVSKAYLNLIADKTGTPAQFTEALAKACGADVYYTDPTDFSFREAMEIKYLSHEQDCLLVEKANNPCVYGKEVSDLALHVLAQVYMRHAKYEVVKSGVLGLLNSDSRSGCADKEDAEGDTMVSLMNAIRKFDCTLGYKLITVIARRSGFDIKDQIRKGMYKDNHGMNRDEQKIVKFIRDNPSKYGDMEAIAEGTGAKVDFVASFIARTNGAAVCDQSLELILENSVKGKQGNDDVHSETDFSSQDWMFTEDNTENTAVRRTLSNTVRYIYGNALTEQEQEVVELMVLNGEKKTRVAKKLGISAGKVEELKEEGLGKCRIYLGLKGYDGNTVKDILDS